MLDKDYYEYNITKEIYAVDKGESEVGKSLKFFFNHYYSTLPITKLEESQKLLNHIVRLPAEIDFNYKIFKDCYIKNINGSLLLCKDFSLSIHIDTENKNMEIKKVKFTCNDENHYFVDFYKKDNETFESDVWFIKSYEKEIDILKLIDRAVIDILCDLRFEIGLKVYKNLEGINIVEITDFLRLFNKIDDEKRIKNYLIEKKFN